MKKKIVGYSNRTRYWQVYAFHNPPDGYIYKRGLDFPSHLLKIKDQFWLNTKFFLPLQGIDLYHTYNSVVATTKPWIVEVESYLPRYGNISPNSRKYRWGMKRIRKNNCRKIIFTSMYSMKMNQENFEENGIERSKTQVIYRAVERYSNVAFEERTFNILFVGNGFYRKGGGELVRAFTQFKHREARLTIISAMDVDWKIFPSEKEVQYVKNIITTDSRITLLSNLTHKEVIQEMRRSHVFVATTFDDPFNNTILEALACGVPCITSNIRSIPEYVFDGVNGFFVDVASMPREEIVNFILVNLERLYNDHGLWQKLSSNALSKCRQIFDISVRNKLLKQVYDQALSHE